VFLSILAEEGLVQDAATLLQHMQRRQRQRQEQLSEGLATLGQQLIGFVMTAGDVSFAVVQQGDELLRRRQTPPAAAAMGAGDSDSGNVGSSTAAALLLSRREAAAAALLQLERAELDWHGGLAITPEGYNAGDATLVSPRLAKLTQETAAAALVARAAVHAWQAAGGGLPTANAAEQQQVTGDALFGNLLTPPVPAKQLLLRAEEAVTTRACAYPGCTNCAGSSGAGTPQGKLCRGCWTVRFCGVACQAADWARHKRACKLLRAQRRRLPVLV
jgi:hypothetical protein